MSGIRCPNCEKFTSRENGDPETDVEHSVENDGLKSTVNFSGSVRMIRNCADCSGELLESNQDIEAEITLEHQEGCDLSDDLDVEIDSFEADESGGGRYSKNKITASALVHVTCPVCKVTTENNISVSESAGNFDSLV